MDFYNDLDPVACEWIRELIHDRLIPEGVVDERSITQIPATDVTGFRRIHFFAGISGWPFALDLAGWPQSEEIWTGSCPCPPFSSAGKKKRCPECGGKSVIPCPRRTGHFICVACEHAWHADGRHLWPEFWRLIAERRPPVVIGEQVAGKDAQLWYAGVRLTLEAIGYRVGAADLCAAGVGQTQWEIVWYEDGHCEENAVTVGPPHIRQRIFWFAVRNDVWERSRGSGQHGGVADTRHRLSRGTGVGQSRTDDATLGHEVPANTERRGGTGDSRELADAGCRGVRPGGLELGTAASGIGGEVREQRVRDDTGDGGDPRGVFHPASDRRGERRAESGGRGTAGGCSDGGVGDTDRAGLGEQWWSRAMGSKNSATECTGAFSGGVLGAMPVLREPPVYDPRNPRPRLPVSTNRGLGEQPVHAFWSASDLIHCRDGKWRRIPTGSAESVLLGLADGLPRVVGGSGTPGGGHGEKSFPLAFEKVEGRNQVLKGVGNAICPQIAAMFVSVVMEILNLEPEFSNGENS